MDILTLVGLAGFAAYIGSYALLQLNYIDGNGVVYTVANISAATMVLISLIEQFNLASMLIQVSWITFGLIGLALRYRNSRRAPGADVASSGRSRGVPVFEPGPEAQPVHRVHPAQRDVAAPTLERLRSR